MVRIENLAARLWARPLLWAALVFFMTAAPLNVCAGESDGLNAVTVEYENLRELLKEGNPALKQSIGEYEDNVAAYQEIWDILKREQGDMEDRADEAEDSKAEDAALYSSNAAMLKSSAGRIYDQIEKLTDEKSARNLEKSADTYTIAAQTLMNSYNQMRQTVGARAKSVEAFQAAYDETLRRQSIGSATQSEVLEAQDKLTVAINTLESLKEQESQLRQKLLLMLGLGGENDIAIGVIPKPDLDAIDAIDIEADKTKAVNNSSLVQEARHQTAQGTTQVNRRFREVEEAEGTAEAMILELYQELLVKKAKYQAAQSACDGALLTYRSLTLCRQAGMLSRAEYLSGEADYLESEAAMENASMALVQAYETYCWAVKGSA